MEATTLVEPGPTNPPRRLVEPFWNVPNAITLSRLGLAVFVFAAVAYGYFFSALMLFVAASLTDALDGYVARKLGQATAIGRQLDPLVDKVIVCGSYIYLLTVPTTQTGLYPWMVTTIVVRELLIQGLRSHLEGGGQAFGAQMAGKLKTCFQCISVSAILTVLWLQPAWVGLDLGPRRDHLGGRRFDGLQRSGLLRPGGDPVPQPFGFLSWISGLPR